ncbi:MAG: hypothetical protein JWM80_4342, partial [Cyanobacteria bacterium RYN_339]|nr:hypothetical protein [Cyanobacteria bacterium RYN_339]
DNAEAIARVLGQGVAVDLNNGGVVKVDGGFGCHGCAATNAPQPPLTQGLGEGVSYGLVVLGWWGYRRWTRRP